MPLTQVFVQDGTIEVRYPIDLPIDQVALYPPLRSSIRFTAASMFNLNNSALLFQSDTASDRL